MADVTPIRRGANFLRAKLRSGAYGLSCLGPDGTPRVSHNKGHLFAGFFIADAVGDELDEVERSVLVIRLLSEEANGHWGYAPRATWDGPPDNPFFVDADDTAFALRLMRRLGLYRSPQALEAYRRLGRRWLGQESGFVTFNTANRPTFCVDPSASANFDMHPEVNANVFLALAGTDCSSWIERRLIAKSQAADGSWHSFFYPVQFYGAAMFMELAAALGGLEKECAKTVAFLTGSQNADGSWGKTPGALETALALKALHFAGAGGDVSQRACDYLLQQQGEDGSWTSDSVVWEFRESDTDVWRARDVNRVVTTALCTGELARRRSDR